MIILPPHFLFLFQHAQRLAMRRAREEIIQTEKFNFVSRAQQIDIPSLRRNIARQVNNSFRQNFEQPLHNQGMQSRPWRINDNNLVRCNQVQQLLARRAFSRGVTDAIVFDIF